MSGDACIRLGISSLRRDGINNFDLRMITDDAEDYCPAGQHCVVYTDGSPGCCPDEGDCPDFLSTVSTVPGGFSTSTSALSSTSSIVSASTTSSFINAPIVSTSSASTSSSFVSAYPTTYGNGTNYTSSTTPSIAVQTTNAGNRLGAAEDLIFALGGVAMLLRWL
nr:hypothetical protein B0A51_07098 [Rachicladosporium sp. CCFEE 5018]